MAGERDSGSDEVVGARADRLNGEVNGTTRTTVGVERQDLPPADVRRDPGILAAREHFGGVNLPAGLIGMLTALAVLVLLGGLIAAALGAIGYQRGVEGIEEELSIAGLVGGVITLFVAYLLGGWAAGRIARYDGPKNGLMTGIWTVLLAALVSALAALLGDEYDVLRRVDLPNWFSRDALTTAALVSGGVSVLAMLLGGMLGGFWGERFHRRVDAEIASTRPGGIIRSEREVRA
ncbi:MAG: hypothetical protein H0T39_07825 [Actinobacteria bacterium]|nr:hypothetical protein [Actinomycetota bacterium]